MQHSKISLLCFDIQLLLNYKQKPTGVEFNVKLMSDFGNIYAINTANLFKILI